MAELSVPRLDFSALGELPKTFRDARDERVERQTLAGLGQALQTGNADYTKIAGDALAGGNSKLGLQLLTLGEAQQKRAREAKAAQEFSAGLGAQPPAVPGAVPGPQSAIPAGNPSDPRGIRNNNPLNIEAGSFTSAMPGFAGSDGRFARFESPEQGIAAADRLLQTYAGKHGLNTVAGIVGRWAPASDGNNVSSYAANVARQLGVDPNAPLDMSRPEVRQNLILAMGQHENGRPIQVASRGGVPTPDSTPAAAAPAQPQVAQADPAVNAALSAPQPPVALGVQVTPRIRHLFGAMANPDLPAGYKEIAKTLLTRELDEAKLDPKVKLYLFDKAQGFAGTRMEHEQMLRKAGATNVTVGDGNSKEFDKKLDTDDAERWIEIRKSGDAARRKIVDIENMREIHNRVGAQGAWAGVKEAIGPFADAFGIDISHLSDIQAYSSVIERLAPQQRPPGSGPTSDSDLRGYRKSLPGLMQNPAAREIGLSTMEALTKDEIARGEIASRLTTKEITRGQAEKELRALPDPMASFKEWRKANPQIYGQALKGGSTPQASPQGAQPRQQAAPQPVADKAAYDALPPNTQYVAPDGTVRTKR